MPCLVWELTAEEGLIKMGLGMGLSWYKIEHQRGDHKRMCLKRVMDLMTFYGRWGNCFVYKTKLLLFFLADEEAEERKGAGHRSVSLSVLTVIDR